MDFALTDAQQQIRDADPAHLRPVRRHLLAGARPHGDLPATTFFQAMAEGGWLGIAMPEA